MKLLMKLAVLAIAVALLLPVIQPDAPVSGVVSSAISDVAGFCERNPDTCDQGQAIAVRAGDLVTHALRSLADNTAPAQPLTDEDLALVPANTTVLAPDGAAAPAQQPAIATNSGLPQP
ncbi:MAG: hypothetical protein AcusKO_27590 [Acuticoccus sp.]